MTTHHSEPVLWAYEVLLAHFEKRKPQFVVSNFLIKKAGCFVSLHTTNGMLRGCIGTIYPVHESLQDEIHANALSAAFRDPRFESLIHSELHDLEISVDILNEPERIESEEMLDPKRYGVIVEDGYHKGVLLPDIPGINTVEEQIKIACQKAGIFTTKPQHLYRFTVTRFH